MSEEDSSSHEDNNSAENSIKFDNRFHIKLTNESNLTTFDRSAKQNCKILQISSSLDINEVLSALKPSEYPKLFILIIQSGNTFNGNPEAVKGLEINHKFYNPLYGNLRPCINVIRLYSRNFVPIPARQPEPWLRSFSSWNATSRPFIILQTCEAADENIKFYYKSENSTEFVDIEVHYSVDYNLYEYWKETIESLLDQELDSFEDGVLKKLSSIKDSSIILRFLRTLNLVEAFFGTIILKVAENGSKGDLLAVLDASFEDNGRILNNQAQNYIQFVFEADVDEMKEELDSEHPSDDDQNDLMDKTFSQPKIEDSSESVLLAAVQNSNKEVIDYLITYWSHLIQELPVRHQIRISKAAFEQDQLDVLCDMLEISDFPFPEDFNHQSNYEKLQKIITDRVKFHEGIKEKNYEKINEFINKNSNSKFIYSPQNITAMMQAIDAKNYKIYYYLKSFGFRATEFSDLNEVLNEMELKKAKIQANLQIKETTCEALCKPNRTVAILCFKSLIHNRKVKKEDEIKYRQSIKEWLRDIYKVAEVMLNVAATCENLVIVFDFESKFVRIILFIFIQNLI